MLTLYYLLLSVAAIAIFFLSVFFEKKGKNVLKYICYALLYVEVLLFV